MTVRLICLCALAASAAWAQQLQGAFTINGNTITPFMAWGGPSPNFLLRADPPDPMAAVSAGSTTTTRGSTQPISISHRYIYDDKAHTYFGYDVVVQPDSPADTYRVAFYELSIGPLDFQGGASDVADPTQWKKLPLPAMPAPRLMHAGDTVETELFTMPGTGQKLIDTFTLKPVPSTSRPGGPLIFSQLQAMQQTTLQQMRFSISQNGVLMTPGRTSGFTPPTVSGEAREFSAQDAEMHLLQARVTINGKPQQYGNTVRQANGPLVWFYVPDHGRYVLSLIPRPELGFVKAGEIRGGVATFKAGQDEVVLESPQMIASGDSPYNLYVLHDTEWEPTAQGQSKNLLFGSVSPRELAALRK